MEGTSATFGIAEGCRDVPDDVPWDLDVWTLRSARKAIRKLAAHYGWSLTAPRLLQRALRARFVIPVPIDLIRTAAMDAAIDGAYPRRRSSERIALGTVAREPMEASIP